MKRKGIQRVCKSKCTLQEGTKNARKSSWVGRWGCRNVVSFRTKVAETSTGKATHWSMTNSLVLICISLLTNTPSSTGLYSKLKSFVMVLMAFKSHIFCVKLFSFSSTLDSKLFSKKTWLNQPSLMFPPY